MRKLNINTRFLPLAKSNVYFQGFYCKKCPPFFTVLSLNTVLTTALFPYVKKTSAKI